MHPQPSMTAAALQAAKGAHGQSAGGGAGRRNDERGPSRLTFGTIRAYLIFGEEHQGLEPFFEFLLRHFLLLRAGSGEDDWKCGGTVALHFWLGQAEPLVYVVWFVGWGGGDDVGES